MWFSSGCSPAAARLSHRTGQRTLVELTTTGLLNREYAGKSILYSINREHLLWPAFEILLGAREMLLQEIVTLLSLKHNPVSVFLFGSVARGTDTSDSDIDIGLLVEKEPEGGFDFFEVVTRIHSRSDSELSVFAFTMADLQRMAETDYPLLASWIQDAIPLAGADIVDLIEQV